MQVFYLPKNLNSSLVSSLSQQLGKHLFSSNYWNHISQISKQREKGLFIWPYSLLPESSCFTGDNFSLLQKPRKLKQLLCVFPVPQTYWQFSFKLDEKFLRLASPYKSQKCSWINRKSSGRTMINHLSVMCCLSAIATSSRLWCCRLPVALAASPLGVE